MGYEHKQHQRERRAIAHAFACVNQLGASISAAAILPSRYGEPLRILLVSNEMSSAELTDWGSCLLSDDVDAVEVLPLARTDCTPSVLRAVLRAGVDGEECGLTVLKGDGILSVRWQSPSGGFV